MNDDKLERRLAEHARRWAAQAPPAPPLDAAVDSAGGRRRRMMWPAVAVAACVVALALVAGLPGLRAVDDHRGLPAAAPTASPSPAPPPTATSGRSSSGSSAELSPDVRARLWPIVVKAANMFGDPESAATAEAVRSTKDEVEALLGGTSSDWSDPVWVVQIHGTLVCASCLRPAGAPASSGTYAVLTIPATGGGGHAFADQPYDLSALGHVYRLTPPAGAATPTATQPVITAEQGMQWKLSAAASIANGGSQLPRSEMVTTTYQAAADFLSIGGAGPDPDTPVWLVQVHGSFVCHDCTSTPGAAGSALTIVIGNVGEGSMTKYGVAGTIYDIGVADQPYDLSSFGVVHGMVP